MKIFRILWRFLRLLSHLFYGIFLMLTTPRYTTHDGSRLPDPEVVSDWMSKVLSIMQIKVSIQGSIPHKKSMLIANHVSWLDIPVIGASSHASFLSKHAISKWPIIGWLAASAGSVFIKRGGGEAQQVADAIASHLQGDRQLAIFPEGTTSDGTGLKRFFPRLFAAAIDTDTPVIPVTLYYTVDGKQDFAAPYVDNQTFIGNLFLLMSRQSSEALIVFNEPIVSTGKDRRTLSEASQKVINQTLQSLRASQDSASLAR